MYRDGTWLQLICCAYSDVLSLYFGWVDGLRFRWDLERESNGNWVMICKVIWYTMMILFQTEELEYMIWGFILEGKNRTEHGPRVGDWG